MNITYSISRESLKENNYATAVKTKQDSKTMKNLNVLVAKVVFQLLKSQK